MLLQLGKQVQGRRIVLLEAGRQLVHQARLHLDQRVLIAGERFQFSHRGTIGLQSTQFGQVETAGLGQQIGINAIGLGSCRESYEWPPGLTRRAPPCSDGTPGLAMRLAVDGLPVLHIINLRRLALEWGLPFDPTPLPIPGNNRAIYGSAKPAP